MSEDDPDRAEMASLRTVIKEGDSLEELNEHELVLTSQARKESPICIFGLSSP
jgi:hypothetical protein